MALAQQAFEWRTTQDKKLISKAHYALYAAQITDIRDVVDLDYYLFPVEDLARKTV